MAQFGHGRDVAKNHTPHAAANDRMSFSVSLHWRPHGVCGSRTHHGHNKTALCIPTL